MKKKQRNNQTDFKLAKYYYVIFRFFGSAVSGYLVVESALQIFVSLEKERIFGVVIFAPLSILFVYLAFKMAIQGYQASKAKSVQELP
ncbi:hypothetical protein [Bacillus sp. REN3]|uniref:hypothetical protein n=1 Tax=Bacillus sp. REN3 TaxID=2802440 RepID=UPI001AEE9536|nr:hypothetical protein [Bacillus sp. REN3]